MLRVICTRHPVEVTGYTEESPTRSNNNSQYIQLAGNEVCSIAPGEGKHPAHFMQDKYCEELAFPVFFQMDDLAIRLKEK